MAFVELLTFAKATCSEEKIYLIVPDKTDDEIPVLYLLHGGSGSCDDWILNSGIARYAEKKGIAVIMPSAGPSRWLKMAVGPNYEEYIIQELPEIVRRFFPRITSDPKHTYIGGLSMGGGGAMELAIMYPEKFAAACILSTSSVIPFEHLRVSDWTPPGPGGDGVPSHGGKTAGAGEDHRRPISRPGMGRNKKGSLTAWKVYFVVPSAPPR